MGTLKSASVLRLSKELPLLLKAFKSVVHSLDEYFELAPLPVQYNLSQTEATQNKCRKPLMGFEWPSYTRL